MITQILPNFTKLPTKTIAQFVMHKPMSYNTNHDYPKLIPLLLTSNEKIIAHLDQFSMHTTILFRITHNYRNISHFYKHSMKKYAYFAIFMRNTFIIKFDQNFNII